MSRCIADLRAERCLQTHTCTWSKLGFGMRLSVHKCNLASAHTKGSGLFVSVRLHMGHIGVHGIENECVHSEGQTTSRCQSDARH